MAIRGGNADAKRNLSSLRQSLAVTAIELADFADEIRAIERDITDLQAARVEAARIEAWEAFLRLSQTVEDETGRLDATIDKFFSDLEPHCHNLEQLNRLLNRAGVEGRGFDMTVFKRFFDVRARVQFGKFFGVEGRLFAHGSVYEKPYNEIMAAKIASLKARHDGLPVVEEPDKPSTNE